MASYDIRDMTFGPTGKTCLSTAAVITTIYIGYFDYRIFYLTLLYFFWLIANVSIPQYMSKIQNVLLWYTLKSYTYVSNTIINFFSNTLVKPIQNTFISNEYLYLINKDGDVIESIKCQKELFSLQLTPNSYNDVEYNFILYYWHPITEDSNYNAYILKYDSIHEVSDKFKFSKIKLLAPSIKVVIDKNKKEVFDLSDEFRRNNYYMCNNKLFDKPFVKWFLKKHHNFELGENLYQIEFIDNNMKPQVLSPNDYIIINESTYDIHKPSISNNVERRPKPLIGISRRTLSGTTVNTDIGTHPWSNHVTDVSGSDKWEKENAILRAGKESQKKVKVDPNATPSHIKYPWGQYY